MNFAYSSKPRRDHTTRAGSFDVSTSRLDVNRHRARAHVATHSRRSAFATPCRRARGRTCTSWMCARPRTGASMRAIAERALRRPRRGRRRRRADVVERVLPLVVPASPAMLERPRHLVLELLPELAQDRLVGLGGTADRSRRRHPTGEQVVGREVLERIEARRRARSRRHRREPRPPCAGRGHRPATRAGARGGARGTTRPSRGRGRGAR